MKISALKNIYLTFIEHFFFAVIIISNFNNCTWQNIILWNMIQSSFHIPYNGLTSSVSPFLIDPFSQTFVVVSLGSMTTPVPAIPVPIHYGFWPTVGGFEFNLTFRNIRYG